MFPEPRSFLTPIAARSISPVFPAVPDASASRSPTFIHLDGLVRRVGLNGSRPKWSGSNFTVQDHLCLCSLACPCPPFFPEWLCCPTCPYPWFLSLVIRLTFLFPAV